MQFGRTPLWWKKEEMMLNVSSDFDFQRGIKSPALISITPENLSQFSNLVQLHKRQDTYTNSAAYFAMTGRKGLWLYGDEETAMVIARHPNDPDQLLVFPPFGNDPVGLIQNACADTSLPTGKLKLARIGPEDTYLTHNLHTPAAGNGQDEDVLDWRYPVHILGTREIVEHTGTKFRDFRKNVHRAHKRELRAEHISSKNHILQAIGICKVWAEGHTNQDYSLNDLLEPTKKALDLLEQGATAMDGIIIYEGEEPISYLIWEETDLESGSANSISGMSIRLRGTDEFAMLEMCKILANKGYKKVCIGGSETEGLDNFKRKMCPVQSVQLNSLRLPEPIYQPHFSKNLARIHTRTFT